jgi:hypothetical protein
MLSNTSPLPFCFSHADFLTFVEAIVLSGTGQAVNGEPHRHLVYFRDYFINFLALAALALALGGFGTAM